MESIIYDDFFADFRQIAEELEKAKESEDAS